ncbi:MAG: hypothetical protein JWQ76_4912, partial [Ramlibacter sp.]|nr:hypothetical protein [Ramlibacter sp.]
KGAGPAAVDLVGGNLDFMFDATAMSLVKSGQLRALAVADSERWPGQPDVPSMAEQGFPNFRVKGFFRWWPRRTRPSPSWSGSTPS